MKYILGSADAILSNEDLSMLLQELKGSKRHQWNHGHGSYLSGLAELVAQDDNLQQIGQVHRWASWP